MVLKEIIKLTGIIEVVNGLHIGGGKDRIEIGGLDNEVIKDPYTKLPYIPGSSLKGKMRFLMEWKLNKVKGSEPHGSRCLDSECEICRIFGTLKKVEEKDNNVRGITRLIVRDALLLEPDKFDPQTMLEIKWQTAIDRTTGTALGKFLRNIERVVPGVRFSMEMAYRVFDIDNDNGESDYDNFKFVIEALSLIENDTLGGSGSRGCGKVKFSTLNITGDSRNNGKSYNGIYEDIEKLKFPLQQHKNEGGE